MPASFDYPRGTQAWRAVAPILGAVPVVEGRTPPMRGVGVLFMVGRLNPGVTPDAARDAWTRANAQVLASSIGPKYDIAVTPFLDHHIGPARQAMWVLFGAVGVLLLIACANVSGLMLTRVSLRNRDDAIRVAIGGTRGAIARLWAAETVWLTVLGGALGLLMCQWLIGTIVALAPEGIPRLDEVAIDWPVALLQPRDRWRSRRCCAAAAPIRHASVVNLRRDAERRQPHGRRAADRIARARRCSWSRLASPWCCSSRPAWWCRASTRCRISISASRARRCCGSRSSRAARRSRSTRGSRELLPRDRGRCRKSQSAGGVYLTPMELGSIGQGTWAIAEGQPETPQTANSNPIVNYLSATPEYFTAMGIPLLRGRMFIGRGSRDAPRVAMISESTAAAFFPGQDPIGKRIKAASFNANQRNLTASWRTIDRRGRQRALQGAARSAARHVRPAGADHGRDDHEPRRAIEAGPGAQRAGGGRGDPDAGAAAAIRACWSAAS